MPTRTGNEGKVLPVGEPAWFPAPGRSSVPIHSLSHSSPLSGKLGVYSSKPLPQEASALCQDLH